MSVKTSVGNIFKKFIKYLSMYSNNIPVYLSSETDSKLIITFVIRGSGTAGIIQGLIKNNICS